MSRELEKAGYNVRSSDFIDRGYGVGAVDFLAIDNQHWKGDIITNPPYIYAQEFVYKALTIMEPGHKLALFMKLQFLASKGRKHLFYTFPPKYVYVCSSRLVCAKNGEFDKVAGSAIDYAWFLWEKGYQGDPMIKWIN